MAAIVKDKMCVDSSPTRKGGLRCLLVGEAVVLSSCQPAGEETPGQCVQSGFGILLFVLCVHIE